MKYKPARREVVFTNERFRSVGCGGGGGWNGYKLSGGGGESAGGGGWVVRKLSARAENLQ